jgi:hypothetical protein
MSEKGGVQGGKTVETAENEGLYTPERKLTQNREEVIKVIKVIKDHQLLI